MKTFSISESLKVGWQKFGAHAGFLIAATVIILAAAFGAEFIKQVVNNILLYPAVEIAVGILNVIVGIWIVRVALDIVDNKTPTFSNILPSWEVFWKYLVSNLLVGVIVTLPIMVGILILVLTIFPGLFGFFAQPSAEWSIDMITPSFGSDIIVAFITTFLFFLASVYLNVRSMFALYFVIDKKSGPIESLRESFSVTGSLFWKLVLLIFAVGLVNILGMVVFGIGLLVTFPITLIATVYVYRTISGGAVASVPPVPSTEGVGEIEAPVSSDETV